MNGRIKSGIRKELFGVIFFILVVNVVVLLFMGSTLFERFYQSNKVGELEQSARTIRAAYQENSEEIYDAIGRLENGNAIVSLFEIDGDGKVQMRYHSRTGREEMRPWGDRENAPKPRKEDADRFQEEMLARLQGANESFDVRLEESFNPWDDDGMLTLSTRLDDNLYLYIQTPRGYLKSFADLAVKYTALTSIAILLVGAVIIYFVVGRITRPIQGIQRAAGKISRLDFSERCEAKGHDEIAMLAESVNQMSDDLQAAVSRLMEANEVLQNDLVRQQQTDRLRQQFVANVSHDFKTPLTLMISYAEALAEEETDPRRRESCEIIIAESNRLSLMVGKLLELSRLESGVEKAQLSIFCLSEVLDNAVRSHRILTERKRLTVKKELEEEYIVSADYSMIEQTVNNLFENAVKYSPEEGVVRLRVQDGGADLCRVSVENSSPPIAEDDLGSLFDSFYRADKSRSREVQGYGLGLAIVKVVMEAHRMDYGVENIEGGVRFWFCLPLAEIGDETGSEEDGSGTPEITGL